MIHFVNELSNLYNYDDPNDPYNRDNLLGKNIQKTTDGPYQTKDSNPNFVGDYNRTVLHTKANVHPTPKPKIFTIKIAMFAIIVGIAAGFVVLFPPSAAVAVGISTIAATIGMGSLTVGGLAAVLGTIAASLTLALGSIITKAAQTFLPPIKFSKSRPESEMQPLPASAKDNDTVVLPDFTSSSSSTSNISTASLTNTIANENSPKDDQNNNNPKARA